MWTKTYGGVNYEWSNSVQQTTDGGFIIAGYTWSYGAGRADVFMVRTNTLGDTLWTNTLGYADGDWANEVDLMPDGGYIIVGTVDYDLGNGDAYIIRISPDTLGSDESVVNPDVLNSLTVEPNPFREKTCISGHILNLNDMEMKIYNVEGQLMRNLPLPSSYSGRGIRIIWNCCDNVGDRLPAGIYLLNCRTRDGSIFLKLILIE